ncbi:hypothetical protein BU17DRAFT_90704 [Hysterangium stoloniferum]|nr:hypothetical protein BU17DRAFT_90704 [Hysterangium stoloniferum]
MPFVSRLKKLGTLPVPELSTDLIVHLIHHEDSEDTNIVYTSCSPISADVPPPPSIRFESPSVHTKPGDVLLWATRVHKKACFVHACWVFNGSTWVKPSSFSEIMMDHPQKPNYQLVVLSGPYVKWEAKADPDREPSLTIPDPPLLRPGARGTVNTIVGGLKDAPIGSPSRQSHETPDGSAGICASSSPLSCIDDEDTELSSPSKVLPVTASFSNTPPAPISDVAQRVRERPRGARPPPSNRQITPQATEPLTPDSTKHTRSRIVRRNETISSVNSSRPCKRTRMGGDVVPSLRWTSACSPALKRRKTDTPARAATQPNLFPSPNTNKSRRNSSNNNGDMSSPRTNTQVNAKTRRLSTSQRHQSSLPQPTQPNNEESVPQDSNVNQRPCPPSSEELRNITPFNLLSPPPPPLKTEAIEVPAGVSGVTLVEDDLIEHVLAPEPAEQDSVVDLSADRVLSDAQKRDQLLMDTTLRQAQLLQAELSRSETALAELKRETTETIAQLTKDRDEAQASLKGFGITMSNLDQAVHRHTLVQDDSQGDVMMQLQAVKAERDELAKLVMDLKESEERYTKDLAMLQSNDESTRFTTLQNSLRAAQDALHRQRTQAQESEARQQGTITQLTKEILQRNISADEMSSKMGAVGKRIKELETSSLTNERKFLEEKATLQHKIDEMEKFQSTGRIDNAEIERLNEVIESKDRDLVAAQEKADRLGNDIQCFHQDRASQDDTITELTRIRTNLEQQLKQAHTSINDIEEMAKSKDAAYTQEQAARKTAESRFASYRDQLSEHIRIFDRDRQTAEHLLLSQRSDHIMMERVKTEQFERLQTYVVKLEAVSADQRRTLQALVDAKSRDAESLRERILQMRKEWWADRTKFSAEFSAVDNRLSEAVRERTALQREVTQRGLELAQAQKQGSSLQASLAAEQQLCKELAAQRIEVEKKLSELRTCLEENVQMKTELHEQSQKLRIKQDECVRLVNKVSESDQLTRDLSSTVQSLERDLVESSKQIEALRHENRNVEGELRSARHINQLKANQAAEALQHAKAEIAEQANSFRVEQRRTAEDLSRLARGIEDLEGQLSNAGVELAQSKKLLANEQATSRGERERLIADLTSSSKNTHALQKQLSESQEQRSLLQQSLDKQKISFEQEIYRYDVALEELTFFEKRMLQSEAQRTDSENNLKIRTADLLEERAGRLQAEKEVVDGQKRFDNLSSSRLSLERELKSCQSKLTDIEDRAQHLEREHSSLHSQITSISTDLKKSQAECVRLRAELDFGKEEARMADQTALKSISDELKASQAEHTRLQAELACEKEKLNIERTLSPDELRMKLAALEFCVEEERLLAHSLRKELVKEQSSNYWSELGSQLLRSLHEVQDQLQVERKARHALQTQLSMRRSEEAPTSRGSSTADLR